MTITLASAASFFPNCLATTLGSLPHKDVDLGTERMFASTPEIPSWVQFPRRDLLENMMIQFTEGMPGLVQQDDRFFFNTQVEDFVDQCTQFYERYLAAMETGQTSALEPFGLSHTHAAGFDAFLTRLPGYIDAVVMLKGQVTGPFTLGINLLDQDRRCAYYDDILRDIIVKTVALKACWQMTQLASFGRPRMIFLDEPSLLNYGSQMFITVSREDILTDLDAVVEVIHHDGGLAGVHCEADTDWSLLMETQLDILSFDAYDHLQAMTLYPTQLQAFLERGGILAWGIVPTLDRNAATRETVETLIVRLDEGLAQFERKGIDPALLLQRALITPSCGAGGVLTEELAERVLTLLSDLSHALRDRYGLSSHAPFISA